MKIWLIVSATFAATWSLAALADSTNARCDIYPVGSDHIEKMLSCTFAQRQGFVTITRDDGVIHELAPVGDRPGNFRDQHGRAAYRQSGLGNQGLIFRLPDESVYVYWNTVALKPAETDNPTHPFSSKDYDATTLLRCRAVGEPKFDTCPAGILRMENGQASIVVQSQNGAQFTVNFMKDDIDAANRDVEARLEGDTWLITIDKKEQYQVPRAAIEGG